MAPDLVHPPPTSNDSTPRTPHAPRAPRAPHSHVDGASELDLIAGLWQEAPFARLPPDAPRELDDYVQDVESPRRVYAIHRASRRHDFQGLVAKYIFQLREGCSVSSCTTATCFTCRKRLAGKAPVRRYNPTSARTLAVYLASQDNPRAGLCPNVRLPHDEPPAMDGLLFHARPRNQFQPDPKEAGSHSASGSRTGKPNRNPRSFHVSPSRATAPPDSRPPSPKPSEAHDRNQPDPTKPRQLSELTWDMTGVTEQRISKDYRSFAATTFGTVAFKMLEWLSPQGVEGTASKIATLGVRGPNAKHTSEPSKQTQDKPVESGPSLASPSLDAVPSDDPTASTLANHRNSHQSERSEPTDPPQAPRDATKSRRKSAATFRTTSSTKPKRRKSVEPVSPPVGGIDDGKFGPKSPRLNSFFPDKLPRSHRANVVAARGVPEIPSKPAFFEGVPAPATVVMHRPGKDTSPEEEEHEEDIPVETVDASAEPTAAAQTQQQTQQAKTEPPDVRISYPLPQTLSRLNPDLIDFICDTFQEDGTAEKNYVGPSGLQEHSPNPQNRHVKGLVRRRRPEHPVPTRQWKAFNEQVLFSVLSNPSALVQSFTKDGKLYDSQTLWYCMLRMTRTTPSLVFHSLWLAAESLFLPPDSLQSVRSPSSKPFPRNKRSLSTFDAGCVMSICLHALVAAVPVASNSRTLYEMSRIRSNGLTLAGRGVAARQPSSICLEYDDAFSNDLTLRLARRLFSAITARQCFSEMEGFEEIKNGTGHDLDVLQPLFSQLDLMSSNSNAILEFTRNEHILHETRVPTLLLDWARTILLNNWDGRPDFSSVGPFGGALALIAAMHENRNLLLLGDTQFRVDYFSDRLDAIETPVAWLTFTSTRQRRHILEYPYIFSPDSLVSFFRSINFSRMSRTFEESSSLKTRMGAIVDPGSLITNPHHKEVLQDLLKTAASKYLILEIGRGSALRNALDQLWRREERELLRPLKVHLGENGGEEGFDSGGVQQEFFRMAIAECLDPDYGAFAVDERTRMAWFAPGSLVEDWKFELVGLLVSIAVYNGLTLPVTLPKAFYRKLLGQPVKELHHIADGWPDLANGLTTLLEWDEKDGLVEDIFARTYEFSVSTFGSNVSREMTRDSPSWPQTQSDSQAGVPASAGNPDDAPLVTNNNRDEYVSDYIRYLTDVSVRPQFLAFERGFRTCLDAKALSLLSPPILQSLVEGVQDIDVSELRRYARYVGWDTSHHTVKDFWSIVKRYDDSMKRKLLEFVTASDRVPVGGMRNLQFVLQKNGEESSGGHLPTAYTCYGTLLLPEYENREVLRERLGMALENAQGFGFA